MVALLVGAVGAAPLFVAPLAGDAVLAAGTLFALVALVAGFLAGFLAGVAFFGEIGCLGVVSLGAMSLGAVSLVAPSLVALSFSALSLVAFSLDPSS